MRILAVSDEECPALWEHYVPGKLKEYDLILSCGDLNAHYLSFLVTAGRAPLLYVHGNHDSSYAESPPEGCDCIDGKLVVYNGVRILGLGGCMRYRPGAHQYTEKEMRSRIRKLRLQLWLRRGVDIVVTHAPPKGIGDGNDPAHWGFQALRDLLDKYQPLYLFHGHVHMGYSHDSQRVREHNGTRVVNAYERYSFEIPDRDVPPRQLGRIIGIKD